jgi:hypothetical protein
VKRRGNLREAFCCIKKKKKKLDVYNVFYFRFSCEISQRLPVDDCLSSTAVFKIFFFLRKEYRKKVSDRLCADGILVKLACTNTLKNMISLPNPDRGDDSDNNNNAKSTFRKK